MNDPHQWINWERYLSIQESYLRRWAHFIVWNRLVLTETPTFIRWKGALVCQDGVEVRVTLTFDVKAQFRPSSVRLRRYSYYVVHHAGGIERPLFRYDDARHYMDQPDPHHRHVYDRDGRELKPPEHVGEESIPTLGDVLAQAYGAWDQMQRQL